MAPGTFLPKDISAQALSKSRILLLSLTSGTHPYYSDIKSCSTALSLSTSSAAQLIRLSPLRILSNVTHLATRRSK